MIKLSVSQAAKLVGVSRIDLQHKINLGQLQAHEGYLTFSSLREAYPNVNPQFEQDKLLKRAKSIKESALQKASARKKISAQNQQLIKQSVQDLKDQLFIKTKQNKNLHEVIDILAHKLALLEHQCHKKDKAPLHDLQNWLKNQMTQH